MLSTAAVAACEALINRALQYDPASLNQLAALDGKILAINITLPALRIYCQPSQQGLRLMGNWQGDIDAELSGSAAALLQLAVQPTTQLKDSGVSLVGDINLVASLQKIVQQLDLDWEELLTQLTGDVIGHQLAQAVQLGLNRLRNRGQNLLHTSSEYLREELRALPGKPELRDFYQQVDELQLRFDRLNAKVNQFIAQARDKTL